MFAADNALVGCGWFGLVGFVGWAVGFVWFGRTLKTKEMSQCPSGSPF